MKVLSRLGQWVRAPFASLFKAGIALHLLGFAYVFYISKDTESALQKLHRYFVAWRNLSTSYPVQYFMGCLFFHLVNCFHEPARYPYTVLPFRIFWQSLWQAGHDYFSRDDGEHGDKFSSMSEERKDKEDGKEKSKDKNRRRNRPPTIDEQPQYISPAQRPQPSPHQQLGVNEPKQRSSSSGSNSGSGKKPRVRN